MMDNLKTLLARWWVLFVLALLLPVYTLIAINNERNVDYVNNGFFTFWLSGHMQWTGEKPYSNTDWVNGHHANGAIWIPNQIFPYPLPLALLTAPLGLLPISQSYLAWDVFAQVLIAVCIVWLAKHWTEFNQQIYAVFVLLAAILNGNIYLGLMTGTLAVLFLLFLILAIHFLETDHPILAGVMLAGLALKPPLLAITALIGIWLLITRGWKVVAGMALGGLGLVLIGLMQDPFWLGKFREVSENLLDRRLGNQPTILSYARLICAGDMQCAFSVYLLISLALVGFFAWLTWKKRNSLTPLMAVSAAVSLGVLLPPYLWSYDYTLLVIPVCYIAFDLIRRRGTYLYSTLFLLLLDIISIAGLVMFWMNPENSALSIQRDMWSIWVAILVLAACWWLIYFDGAEKPAKKRIPRVPVTRFLE